VTVRVPAEAVPSPDLAGTPLAGPATGAPHPSGRRAPWWLWVLAVGVLVPVVVPVAALFIRTLASAGTAADIIFSPRTLELVIRSAVLTVLVTTTATTIGIAVAWLTTRSDLRGRRTWAVLATMPLVIPSYVLALAFLAAGGPRGIIADLTPLAFPTPVGLPGAWLALTLSTYPFVLLTAAAALQRVDPALEEAARGLGASDWRVFRTITLPQLRPAIGAGALLVALYTLSDFGAVSLLRFDSFTRVIYAQYQGRLDRTPAVVLSVILIVIALVIIWGEGRTRGRAVYYGRGFQQTPKPHRLSRRGRILAIGFLGSVVTAGLILPIGVLVAWVARASLAGDQIRIAWNAAVGSLVGSSLAALVAMAAAIPIVILAVRHRDRASTALDRSVYVVFSLPHITVALAVVVFAVRYLGPLYQSLALLVVVYAIIFLAQATGSARASLLQVNPHLEEASRSLGKTPLRTIVGITIPLMWKGLLAGGALVFLTTMKELPATLLLRPTGYDTLAVRIWSAAEDLFYGRAAASALLLLAISAVPMYFLVVRPKDAVP
jgi:iron(III) transport system permease protein